MNVITCAWCERPATAEVETLAAGTVTITTSGGREPVLRPSKRFPACSTHSHPEAPRGTPRRSKGPIPGQIDIFDALREVESS